MCEQIAKSEHAEEKVSARHRCVVAAHKSVQYSLEDMDADINWKLIDEDRAEELQQRWEQITSNVRECMGSSQPYLHCRWARHVPTVTWLKPLDVTLRGPKQSVECSHQEHLYKRLSLRYI